MVVNSRGVELPLVAGLAFLLVGASAGETAWDDHDERGWKALERGDSIGSSASFDERKSSSRTANLESGQ
jgi:hypothetical protein